VERLVAGTGSTPAAVLTRFDPDRGECVTPGGPYDPGSTLTAECAYRSRVGKFTPASPVRFRGRGSSSGSPWATKSDWFVRRFFPSSDPFPAAPDLRASFARAYFRISERTSDLYVQYDAFTPRYKTYRDLDTYDLAEDQRLGPSLTLKFGRASTWLGSEADFFVYPGRGAQSIWGFLAGFKTSARPGKAATTATVCATSS
jgi:hypothetical protein